MGARGLRGEQAKEAGGSQDDVLQACLLLARRLDVLQACLLLARRLEHYRGLLAHVVLSTT
jgi:hypothetical protein